MNCKINYNSHQLNDDGNHMNFKGHQRDEEEMRLRRSTQRTRYFTVLRE